MCGISSIHDVGESRSRTELSPGLPTAFHVGESERIVSQDCAWVLYSLSPHPGRQSVFTVVREDGYTRTWL